MGPKKYSVDELNSVLDEKLAAFKDDIVKQVTDSIVALFENKLKEKDEKIEKLESQVAMIQEHVTNLKHANERKLDDLEQYGRRVCLRIDGVPFKEKETSQEVLEIVKEKVDESTANIPDTILDRAHRIGKQYIDRDSGIKIQSIIVRFTTFRHRTLLYKNRKNIKGNVRVKLDLTKKRYEVLRKAREIVEEIDNISFVYADINCRLKVRFKDNSELFFENLIELYDLIEKQCE